MSSSTFHSLNLQPELLTNLDSLQYTQMTPVQAQSLPLMLEGTDVIAQGKTGSGKTAAFGLALLNKLKVKQFRVQSLVLCPTRELADQVSKEIRRLGRRIHNIKVLTLCGGMPFGPQIGSLEHGAHIVVGTPGRIEEHLRKGNLSLDHLTTLVLDEADRMLDMGFQAALDAIMSHVPEQRQTLLFSATFPSNIQSLSETIMLAPEMIKASTVNPQKLIQQHYYQVGSHASRIPALITLLHFYRPGSAVVFCQTKRETDELAEALKESGFSALALHGDLEQKQRDQTLVRFANRSVSILVATDVAARGLDIEQLDAVFVYQLSRETDVHIHRIGRTGRAGSEGLACTLLTDKDQPKLESLAAALAQEISFEALPKEGSFDTSAYSPPMATLQLDGGKKQKVRPGDILGALTGKHGIEGKYVGKIHIMDNCAYVAVSRKYARDALSKLSQDGLKGRSFRVRLIRDS